MENARIAPPHDQPIHNFLPCPSHLFHLSQKPWNFASPPDTLSGMHKIIEIFADRAALHTEILALRQQVAVLKRKRPRPLLRKADRVFWVILSCLWPGWRHALVIVRPRPSSVGTARGSGFSGHGSRGGENRADRRCRGRSAIWSDGCCGRTHGGAHLGSMTSF